MISNAAGGRVARRTYVTLFWWLVNGMSEQDDTWGQAGGAVKERTKPKRKQEEPALFKVILLNDDYSTMDFVIQVLQSVFLKPPGEAYRIMMAVHLEGRGLAGVYPWEIAETKVETVTLLARDAGFPLRATLEEA